MFRRRAVIVMETNNMSEDNNHSGHMRPEDTSPSTSGDWDGDDYFGTAVDMRGKSLSYRVSPSRGSVSIMSQREYNLWGQGTSKRNWDKTIAKREAIHDAMVEDGTVSPDEKKGGCSSCNQTKDAAVLQEAKQATGFLDNVKKFAKGVPGAIKANFGADQSSLTVIQSRRAICNDCDLYDFGICNPDKGGCGCVLAWKVRVKSESCPKGKWKAVVEK